MFEILNICSGLNIDLISVRISLDNSNPNFILMKATKVAEILQGR
jgi:hypothetical protein